VEIPQLIAFNVALIAAILSPGPAMLFSLQTSLHHGRKSGIVAGLGLGFMAATWTLLALLGVNSLFALFPWAFAIFKVAGALYLIYIAWKTWMGATKAIVAEERPKSSHFKSGLLVNLANPKSVLFAAALIVVIFPVELSGFEKLLVIVNHFLVECIAYGLFAFLITTKSVSDKYLRAKTIIDRCSATVLAGLAVPLLFNHRQ